MRRQILRVLAAVAALVIVTPIGGPAAAGEVPWKRIPCTEGGIDRVAYDAASNRLALEWHLDCADPSDSPAAWAYALYAEVGPLAEVSESVLIAYAPTAPTTFAQSRHVPPLVDAICVVTDYDVRIACVGLYRDSRGTLHTVSRLATDDPLVQMKARVFVDDHDSSPACGSCW
ncbi:hypothetical protein [Phytohabitans kaempferiae]|uniref:Uncharacterized protein n=1 Tax=Phytohabitans kaempferiae TaxID=1620943 RepID=A0ABV6LUK4_9ACTN